MDVSVIYVPFMAGDANHPAAEGCGRYARSGVERLLASRGVMVDGQRVNVRPDIGPDTASASKAVNQELRLAVRSAISAARLPIVLAGSCDAGIGVVAGLPGKRYGIIWIDAHGDFNTPESSISGFFPGMSLAILTGHCYPKLWASVSDHPPIPEDRVVLAGVRSLSPPAEARRLRDSAIQVIPWKHGKPQGDINSVLDRLAGQIDGVYLHIDNDAFDPSVAPGIVDEPVPGGLSLDQMELLLHATTSRLPLAAVTIATYTPANDQQDRTLESNLRILELLGDHAATQH
jgi:arginase